MNLKAILTKAGITENVDEIVDNIKSEICTEFVSKKQYAKKNERVDELEGKLADLELSQKDDYKQKYEALETEFNDYKNNLEVEKNNKIKSDAIVEHLKESGVNVELIDLLKDRFDVNEIELEDNKIKDWEDKIKPIQEKYKNFFTVSEEQGQGVNIPPVNNSNQDKTNPLADALGKLI